MWNRCFPTGLLTLGSLSFTTANTTATDRLLDTLQPYIKQVAIDSPSTLPKERTMILDKASRLITEQLKNGRKANLTFICTHNSRRSHLAQVWAQAAAHHFALPDVHTFSGGTETTACNIRTVRAMRRAGHSIATLPEGDNPKYLVQFSENAQPLACYSKRYNSPENPAEDYVAMMCCADVSEKCPVVTGATSKVALHYLDPKIADDTPQEAERYDERCRQIAEEMFYLMAQVKSQLSK